MGSSVIQFDYDYSPYAQKTRALLTAAGVDFKKCDQPMLLPRPDLEALGITYRRIPLLAVGKDIYADSSLIIDVVLKLGKVPTSPADKAYEEWGNKTFYDAFGLIPAEELNPQFVKDRGTIFPSLKRPDIKTIRPSAVAGFIGRLKEIEDGFLAGSKGPFINGEKISLADINFMWPVKFAVGIIAGREPALGRDAFPKVYKLLDSWPSSDPQVLSAEETRDAIIKAQYTAKGPDGVAKDDPTGFEAGKQVSIESFDSEPGSHPQVGKLIGLDQDEVVIEVKHGIHLHFPRIGYIVRAQ